MNLLPLFHFNLKSENQSLHLLMALMVSHIFLRAAGSTPVVGSSNNITFGLRHQHLRHISVVIVLFVLREKEHLPMRARATLSFLLLPPLYWPQGRSRYWVRSTKLASFSSSLLIRFSELRRPRIRAKRVNISLPVNTLVS